jgi:hypothetical protein
MEADIRDMTDREGFCRAHFKKMFDYGNALGNAWILKTLTLRHVEEMQKEFKHFKPESSGKKSGLFSRKTAGDDSSANSIVSWINRRESSCFICNTVQNTFSAYTKTFFDMYRRSSDFRKQVAETKGFCLSHFKVLCEGADEMLNAKEREDFYRMVLPLMEKNMERIHEDIAWFVEITKTKTPTGKIPRMPSSAACRSSAAGIHRCRRIRLRSENIWIAGVSVFSFDLKSSLCQHHIRTIG